MSVSSINFSSDATQKPDAQNIYEPTVQALRSKQTPPAPEDSGGYVNSDQAPISAVPNTAYYASTNIVAGYNRGREQAPIGEDCLHVTMTANIAYSATSSIEQLLNESDYVCVI